LNLKKCIKFDSNLVYYLLLSAYLDAYINTDTLFTLKTVTKLKIIKCYLIQEIWLPSLLWYLTVKRRIEPAKINIKFVENINNCLCKITIWSRNVPCPWNFAETEMNIRQSFAKHGTLRALIPSIDRGIASMHRRKLHFRQLAIKPLVSIDRRVKWTTPSIVYRRISSFVTE